MRRCGGISLTANFSSPPSFLLQYICMEERMFLTIFFFSSTDRYYLYPILGQQQFSGTNLAACILHGKSIHSQYIYLTEFPLLLLLCVAETYMQKYFFSLLLKSIIAVCTLTRFLAPIYCWKLESSFFFSPVMQMENTVTMHSRLFTRRMSPWKSFSFKHPSHVLVPSTFFF